jgi:subtilisin family serine protease
MYYILSYHHNITNKYDYRTSIGITNCTDLPEMLMGSICWTDYNTIHDIIQDHPESSQYIINIVADIPLELETIEEVSIPFTLDTKTVGNHDDDDVNDLGDTFAAQHLFAASHQDYCTNANNVLDPVFRSGMPTTIRRPEKAQNGSNVIVYVIDTGADCTHGGITCSSTTLHLCNETACVTKVHPDHVIDEDGHGTHCAGIIAGKYTGIAPEVTLIPIKLETLGLLPIVQGLEQVYKDHLADPTRKRVVSLSIGMCSCPEGECTCTNTCAERNEYLIGLTLPEELITAFMQLKNAHIPVVKAAGNIPCNISSPMITNVTDALIVVGNAQMNRVNTNNIHTHYCSTNSPSTNYGPLVDIMASGTKVLSTYSNDVLFISTSTRNTDDCTTIIDPAQPVNLTNLYIHLSGTSMSTPLVAGVIALIMNVNNDTNMTVEDIRTQIKTNWSFPDSITFMTPTELSDPLTQFNNPTPDYSTTTRRHISAYPLNNDTVPVVTSSPTISPTTTDDDSNGMDTTLILIISISASILLLLLMTMFIYTFTRTTNYKRVEYSGDIEL